MTGNRRAAFLSIFILAALCAAAPVQAAAGTGAGNGVEVKETKNGITVSVPLGEGTLW